MLTFRSADFSLAEDTPFKIRRTPTAPSTLYPIRIIEINIILMLI